MVDLHARRLPLDHEDDDRGRHPGHHRRVHLPARLARHAHRRHRPAAVDHPGLLGASTRRASRSISSACSPSPSSPASWSTTPSSRSRTSCATCAWANRPIAPRWRPPTRSASPSSPSRLTIIAVFVPVSFMGGIAGQYFKQFGLVVAFAVFFSLLVARLITPLLAAYFMRPSHHSEQGGLAAAAYTRLVRWSVAHHYKTRGARACDLRRLDRQLLSAARRASCPPTTAAALLLAVELPPGSRMADTRAVTDTIARNIRARPDVQERVHQRRPRDGLGRRGAQGDARHQPGAEGAAQAHPGPGARRDRPQPRRRARHPLLVPARTTASASCSWWPRAAMPPPSRTSRPS